MGSLIITIRPRIIMEKLPFTPYGFRLYSTEELKTLLIENNFEIVNVLEKDEPAFDIEQNSIPMSLVMVHAKKKT